jgi:hypothetical protein
MNPKRYHFSRLPERVISLLFLLFLRLSNCQPGSACTTKVYQGQNVLCQVSYSTATVIDLHCDTRFIFGRACHYEFRQQRSPDDFERLCNASLGIIW